jgi:ABC-type transporter MlaC component
MLEKSKYNPETALRIVETAVANCWKGLQEERQQFKPSGKSKVQEQHEDLVSYVMQKRNLLNG